MIDSHIETGSPQFQYDSIPLQDGVELHLKPRENRPWCFVAHGLTSLESHCRTVAKLGQGTGNEVIGSIGGSDLDYWKPGEVCRKAWESDRSVASIDALDLALKDDFSVRQYADAIDQVLDLLFEKGKVEVAFAQSVGTLAMVDAIRRRILDHKPVPDRIILVDPIIGGLCPTAKWFLQETGQLNPPIPGLADIMPHPSSSYLREVQEDLLTNEIVRKNFPQTVMIYGDVGSGHYSMPIGAVPVDSNVGQAFTRCLKGLEPGGDGMVALDGAKGKKDGQYLISPDKLILIQVLGAVHAGTRQLALGAIEKIFKSQNLDNMTVEKTHGLASMQINCIPALKSSERGSILMAEALIKYINLRRMAAIMIQRIQEKALRLNIELPRIVRREAIPVSLHIDQ